jgi:hypothetical protein
MKQARRATEDEKWYSGWPSLPKMWSCLGYTLPRDVRERAFRPAFYDLHQDYLMDLADFRLKAKQRRMRPIQVFLVRLIMNLAFPLWTAKLVYECFMGAFKQRE